MSKVKKWFSSNSNAIKKSALWLPIVLVVATGATFAPAVDAAGRLIDLATSGVVALNMAVVYLAFIVTSRAFFKPEETFGKTVGFAFRKDILTTITGVVLFAVAFINAPAIVTNGLWHMPSSAVPAIIFLFSWIILSYSMKRIYEIQFLEEVLSDTERTKYLEAQESKPGTKKARTGMFLVDIRERVQNVGARLFPERKRTHKLIFPPLQALIVLLSPALLLFWTLWIFNLQMYTYVSGIAAPVVIFLASAIWTIWHVKGGTNRIVTRRAGRVMESAQKTQ